MSVKRGVPRPSSLPSARSEDGSRKRDTATINTTANKMEGGEAKGSNYNSGFIVMFVQKLSASVAARMPGAPQFIIITLAE